MMALPRRPQVLDMLVADKRKICLSPDFGKHLLRPCPPGQPTKVEGWNQNLCAFCAFLRQ
jgi:hypothetical protein